MSAGPSPLISVIVVNYNRRDLLRACLQSLLSQAVPDPGGAASEGAPLEIIVVDNGSQDGSAEMIERDFPANGASVSVRLIRNSENRGFCGANNQGIRESRGELIALLNNDAEAAPGWLAALRRAFVDSPETGMAASKILMYEQPGRLDKAGHLIYPDGQNRGRGSGEPDDGRYDRAEEVLWPDGCAAMYRKKMLDQIGGFDEDFFAYADDAELGLRARIAGWRCMYQPDAVVRHHRGSTLGLSSPRRLELIERNRVLLALKLFPWSLLWLNGFYYAARLLHGAWAGIQGTGETSHFPGMAGKFMMAKALLRGDLQALRLAPRMLQKRRLLRGLRKLTPSQVRHLILSNRISLSELTR